MPRHDRRRLPMPLLLIILLPPATLHGAAPTVNTTDGFTAVPLTEAQFSVQKPYDTPVEQRYEFAGGVRRMWVYSTDKPFSHGSPTKPRTEIHILKSYSSGVWQFEGYGYVPAGTTGVCVMQVFGASPPHASTLMLRVYGGRLLYYHDEARVVDGDIYDRWFKLNVIHDADAAELTVFIDGEERLAVAGRGGHSYYFKVGVYTQTNSSYKMESRWRDIKVFSKA
ncbi:hypothetical protein ACP70R_020017 [Stipagrostis hirtigluma subsp. patula]